MTKLRVHVVLISFAILSVNSVEPSVQESLTKLLGSFAGVKHVRVPELLNQLCSESQGSNIMLRDACYGCFYRATSLPIGYPLLLAMSNCADLYLNNTDYSHCQIYLNNATTLGNTKINPTTIYCTFLECVRQVNKDTLLRECVGEAIRMFPSFNLTDVNLAQLYVNTTACVLAKTRCAHTNPITGQYQEDDLANKLNIPTINALLINTDYDINILQLPFHYSTADICIKYRNYEQASWSTAAC